MDAAYGMARLLSVGTMTDVLVIFGTKAVIYEHSWILVFQLLTILIDLLVFRTASCEVDNKSSLVYVCYSTLNDWSDSHTSS